MERLENTTSADSRNLGELANPLAYRSPLLIAPEEGQKRLRQLRKIIEIRCVEDILGEMVARREVKCPCHLGIGQEAAAVGVAEALTPEDKLFGNHRSHSHYLALGGSVHALFAETLGKKTGCSRGMGGSMHLYAPQHGLQGTVPIVGGTIPLAVGAALGLKLQRKQQIAVCFFGDGAVEEGVLHESLNLAAHRELPVLFVCENNLYSSHLDIALRQKFDRMARFAEAQGVLSATIDGNAVDVVEKQTVEFVEKLRQGKGPVFLELVTYRHRGHVGPDENIDVGLRRSRGDLEAWKMRDPLVRLSQGLIQAGMLSIEGLRRLELDVREECLSFREQARTDPFPETSLLLQSVFGDAST